MDETLTTWQGLFFRLIILGVLSFLVFRLLGKVFPRYMQKAKWYINLMQYLPAIELGYWFLFLSWFTLAFAEIKSIFGMVTGALLLILAFWISQFILKDIIARMAVKLFDQIKVGDKIELEEIEVVIQKLGWQNIVCEKPDGTEVLIPFHKLTNYKVMRKDLSNLSGSHNFRLEVPNGKEAKDLSQEIKSFLIALPTTSIHQTPEVRLIDSNPDKNSYSITVYPVKRSFGNKIEKELFQKFVNP